MDTNKDGKISYEDFENIMFKEDVADTLYINDKWIITINIL